MDFEYDPGKSASNKAKHGIDFEEAQALWNDEDAIVADTRYVGERRYVLVGRIGGRHWTAVFTFRGDNIIRIISVRRSRAREVEHYENNRAQDDLGRGV